MLCLDFFCQRAFADFSVIFIPKLSKINDTSVVYLLFPPDLIINTGCVLVVFFRYKQIKFLPVQIPFDGIAP